jgi:sporulation protein YlmC with PRC-barrel domain
MAIATATLAGRTAGIASASLGFDLHPHVPGGSPLVPNLPKLPGEKQISRPTTPEARDLVKGANAGGLEVRPPSNRKEGERMPQMRNVKGQWMQSVMAADTLTGNKVVNRQNEDLGTVEHLMIDMEKGCVAYAVLSFGGFLGMGDKLFAIPWISLMVDTDEKQFVLDIGRQALESAPGFDRAHWPNMADRAWSTEVSTYYGAKPYWT